MSSQCTITFVDKFTANHSETLGLSNAFPFTCSVLYNIMSNEFVPAEYKQRLRTAARTGRDFQQCSRYDCPALSQ